MRRVALCCAVAIATGVSGGALAGSSAVVAGYRDAKFVPVDPARPELAQIAVLRGDPATGPSSMLMKMPRTQGVLHFHTSDYELVLVEGRMKHTFEGRPRRTRPSWDRAATGSSPGGSRTRTPA